MTRHKKAKEEDNWLQGESKCLEEKKKKLWEGLLKCTKSDMVEVEGDGLLTLGPLHSPDN